MQDAFQAALQAKTDRPVLSRLFREAIPVGMQTRASSGIASHPATIGTIAGDLTHQALGRLAHPTALVVGTGKRSHVQCWPR